MAGNIFLSDTIFKVYLPIINAVYLY